MRLLWAELRDFRNHRETRVSDVPEGLVTVVGPNGEGKTNLLEGIAFLFFLASPRVSATLPLVREGAEAAYSRGEVETTNGRVLIEVEIPGKGANRVQVNRSPVRRKRDVKRQVRAVFFGPDDLDVVRGEPGERRRFMDEAATSLWPLKESALTAYDRTLRQRNRLLKDWEDRGAPTGLDAWDAELIANGSALTRLRAQAVDMLAPSATEEYEHLAGYELECTYAPNVTAADPAGLEQAFAERLVERRPDELIRRTTLVGPHRDDLTLAVRELGARSFASHGESWAAALCLRLGLASAVTEEVKEVPVLLLDDPFSALDPRRQHQVAERLTGRGQVFVSVADEAHVPDVIRDGVGPYRWVRDAEGGRLMPSSKGWKHRKDERTMRDTAIGDVLDGLMRERAFARGLPIGRLAADWATVVGARVAAESAPVSLDGGVLVIAASSGPWGAQVRFLAEEIRKKVNLAFGEEHVKRVQIVVRDDPRKGL